MEPARDEKYAADALGVTTHCMQAWRKRGGGPVYHKFGKKVVYFDDDLETYKNACRRENTSQRATA